MLENYKFFFECLSFNKYYFEINQYREDYIMVKTLIDDEFWEIELPYSNEIKNIDGIIEGIEIEIFKKVDESLLLKKIFENFVKENINSYLIIKKLNDLDIYYEIKYINNLFFIEARHVNEYWIFEIFSDFVKTSVYLSNGNIFNGEKLKTICDIEIRFTKTGI